MTAILISRELYKGEDTLYIVADQRVTSDDKVISDRNQKVFSFGPTKTRKHGRHYVTVGDVDPTDYILHRLESMDDMESLYQFVMESEQFTKMPHDATIIMINDIKDAPDIVIINKSSSYTGTRIVDMEELRYAPLYSGTGGLYVKVALDALKDLLIPDMTYECKVKLAFHAAAKSVVSMNDILTIIKLPIKETKKRKK
ncbi:hypothetical protein UFOVP1437_26 [uncultured Caudovirales phage]|uniref:Uncharacterized protein n=1 Tax=uncultured Caudovirales phage TaxID=2100421 RepID=A0A6J7XE68_9CAUD|nr:hypothetical protein UFOVP1437_26 [uncultured Caudovirales phage]CAB5228144.1 hypothetical protein UFOVP1531_38 [uncultured Caudovirales phage]